MFANKKSKKRKDKGKFEGYYPNAVQFNAYRCMDSETEWTTKEGSENEDDEVENGKCPYSKEQEVFFDVGVWQKIQELTRQVDDEWIGYLIGEFKDMKARITDLAIPEQYVSGASCESLEGDPPKGTVGWVHSHDDMGVFYSGTDDVTNQQHFISLVVNKKSEYKLTAMMRLPCKAKIQVPAKLILMSGIDVSEFIKSVKPKIFNSDTFKDECLYSKNPKKCKWKKYSSCSFSWKDCPYKEGTAINVYSKDDDKEDSIIQKIGYEYHLDDAVATVMKQQGLETHNGKGEELIPICPNCSMDIEYDDVEEAWVCEYCDLAFARPCLATQEEWEKELSKIPDDPNPEDTEWSTEDVQYPLSQESEKEEKKPYKYIKEVKDSKYLPIGRREGKRVRKFHN